MTVFNFNVKLHTGVRLKHTYMKNILTGSYTYEDVDECCNWYWTEYHFSLDGLMGWGVHCARATSGRSAEIDIKVPENIRDFFQQYIDFVEPRVIDYDGDDDECI